MDPSFDVMRDQSALRVAREALVRRLQEVESTAEKYRAGIAALDLVLGAEVAPQISMVDALAAPASLNGTSYAVGWTQTAATRDYLTKAGPSRVPQIAEALKARGMAAGPNFRTNIHSLLRKVDWAEKLDDGRWQIREGY